MGTSNNLMLDHPWAAPASIATTQLRNFPPVPVSFGLSINRNPAQGFPYN
jgi:hypothetical protein